MDAKNEIDKIIMLFSADWFAPYFSLCFSDIDDKDVCAIKLSARHAVGKFMFKEPVYWNISFAPERLRETKKYFQESLIKSDLNGLKVESIINFFNAANDLNEEEETTVWLFWELTEALAKEDENHFPLIAGKKTLTAIRQEITDIINNKIQFDLESIALASQTVWDIYLRSLTPDLPTYLSDYAINFFVNFDRFRVFWWNMRKKLDDSELNSLVKWYEKKSSEITDPNFKFRLPKKWRLMA